MSPEHAREDSILCHRGSHINRRRCHKSRHQRVGVVRRAHCGGRRWRLKRRGIQPLLHHHQNYTIGDKFESFGTARLLERTWSNSYTIREYEKMLMSQSAIVRLGNSLWPVLSRARILSFLQQLQLSVSSRSVVSFYTRGGWLIELLVAPYQ